MNEFNAFEIARLSARGADARDSTIIYARDASARLVRVWSAWGSELRNQVHLEVPDGDPTLESFAFVYRQGRRTLEIHGADLNVDVARNLVYVKWFGPRVVVASSGDAILRMDWTEGLPSSSEIFLRVKHEGVVSALANVLRDHVQTAPDRVALPIAILKVELNGRYEWLSLGECDKHGLIATSGELECPGCR